MDFSTEKNTVLNSLNSDIMNATFSDVLNSDEIDQISGEKSDSNSSKNLMDTALETVPKSLNFPAKSAITDTESESLKMAGLVPRSIRDLRQPLKYSDYKTDFAQTNSISRIKIGRMTDNDANIVFNRTENLAIKKSKRKRVAKMQQNKCTNSHVQGQNAAKSTRVVKGCYTNNNFTTKQQINTCKSGNKHLTKVTDFDQFSRQNQIENIQSRTANHPSLVNQSQGQLTDQSQRLKHPLKKYKSKRRQQNGTCLPPLASTDSLLVSTETPLRRTSLPIILLRKTSLSDTSSHNTSCHSQSSTMASVKAPFL